MNGQLEKAMVDAIPDGMLLVDAQGRILRANKALQTMSGYAEHDLLGATTNIFLPPAMRVAHAGLMRQFFTRPAQRYMSQEGSRLKLYRRDGAEVPIDVALSPCTIDNQLCVLAFVRDLRPLKNLEDRVNYQATHDTLTGLHNRWQFSQDLNQALADSALSSTLTAVMILDLDNFKTINDGHGHNAGDQVLISVANRLRLELPPGARLARQGGDEFLVLVAGLHTAEQATSLLENLLDTLKAPFILPHGQLEIMASAGLAIGPLDATDGQTLMRFTDMALYHAKDAGRGRYLRYSSHMSQSLDRRMKIHHRLRQALKNNSLELHYQPQIDLDSGCVVSVEALLRWTDDELGYVPADQFVAVAEASGLMDELGLWVLETACKQLSQWQSQGLLIRMAVNLSAQQFHQPHLIQQLGDLIWRHGLRPGSLELELTESQAMSNPEQARIIMQRLSDLGFNLAIDDFGTGYSSLAYLQLLPINRVKIDRSFVARIDTSEEGKRLIRGIIGLAHSLGKEVIAEGVETIQQLNFLQAFGCNGYQGWYFAKAMPASDLVQFVKTSQYAARRMGDPQAAIHIR